ncbi:hypothetical protein N7491_008434 [Penicillium cf. griseofulvum]|uniref:Uncharacterized protein n=1 Tax=Penicillium cf. griseofulvum TaxID=2972120 RepID=A0A9W9MG97_9EURO|nr:hypothetical protein N7472_005964 [Penicillium cf. griseofulvum]KAJ5423218.1 hypothetical protein N7491_008434 [Penicillium cf. griseofulvum]
MAVGGAYDRSVYHTASNLLFSVLLGSYKSPMRMTSGIVWKFWVIKYRRALEWQMGFVMLK